MGDVLLHTFLFREELVLHLITEIAACASLLEAERGPESTPCSFNIPRIIVLQNYTKNARNENLHTSGSAAAVRRGRFSESLPPPPPPPPPYPPPSPSYPSPQPPSYGRFEAMVPPPVSSWAGEETGRGCGGGDDDFDDGGTELKIETLCTQASGEAASCPLAVPWAEQQTTQRPALPSRTSLPYVSSAPFTVVPSFMLWLLQTKQPLSRVRALIAPPRPPATVLMTCGLEAGEEGARGLHVAHGQHTRGRGVGVGWMHT